MFFWGMFHVIRKGSLLDCHGVNSIAPPLGMPLASLAAAVSPSAVQSWGTAGSCCRDRTGTGMLNRKRRIVLVQILSSDILILNDFEWARGSCHFRHKHGTRYRMHRSFHPVRYQVCSDGGPCCCSILETENGRHCREVLRYELPIEIADGLIELWLSSSLLVSLSRMMVPCQPTICRILWSCMSLA